MEKSLPNAWIVVYRRLLLFSLVLAAVVVSLGAYVRLSDAGLGCPDWPGCYGHLIGVPESAEEQSAAHAAFGKPVETPKAWKEMLHRYLAGTLGLSIAALTALSWRLRRALPHSPALPGLLFLLVSGQALLGMWTVTLLLRPVIVTAHLLGGMATLSLLLWLYLRVAEPAVTAPLAPTASLNPSARRLGGLALIAVVAQIALGGWVSSNYAALACADFPTCGGRWLPEMDFAQGFQLHRELGETASGDLLTYPALTAIHWAHRLGALMVTVAVLAFAASLARLPGRRRETGLLLGVLLLQLGLGIGNVLLSLPLPLAVAHNSGAALLLGVVLALKLRLWPARQQGVFHESRRNRHCSSPTPDPRLVPTRQSG